eukprot:jgi/Bigna1/79518/fgenesh1_pg.63_\
MCVHTFSGFRPDVAEFGTVVPTPFQSKEQSFWKMTAIACLKNEFIGGVTFPDHRELIVLKKNDINDLWTVDVVHLQTKIVIGFKMINQFGFKTKGHFADKRNNSALFKMNGTIVFKCVFASQAKINWCCNRRQLKSYWFWNQQDARPAPVDHTLPCSILANMSLDVQKL